MATFYDKDGNEITAFSQEELEAEKQAAIAAEKAKVQADLDEAAKLKDKDHNFETLKSSLTQKEQEIETLKKTTKESEDLRVSEIKKDVLKAFAGEDAELMTKLDEEMKTFRGEPKTKDEMIALAQKAMAIVKPEVRLGAFDSFSTGGGRAPSAGGSGAGKDVTPEVKVLGSKLGLSEDDLKKYGN
jgi:Skp family chaperone for outer membrane proteins